MQVSCESVVVKHSVLPSEPASVPARTVRIQEPSKEELDRTAGEPATKPGTAGEQPEDAAADDDTMSAPKKGISQHVMVSCHEQTQ